MAKTFSQIPPGGVVIGNESFVAIRPSGSESDDEDVLLDMGDVVQHILNQDSSIGGGGDASSITFTPADNANWEGSNDPGDVNDALDELASRLKAVEVSGGGGGDFVKIADVVTSGSQATVTFSSIPGTYRHLKLVGYGRGSASSVASEVIAQFNGDTGANYDFARWTRNGTSENVAQTAAVLGELSAANAPSNAAGSLEIIIPHYANTTFQKPYHGTGNARTSTITNGIGLNTTGGTWRSTAAISSMSISLASGNFVDGSVFTLYGLA